jgi:DNA-binding transcriptional ArsR family regulator
MEAEHVFRAVADHHRRQLLDSLARADGQTLTELCVPMPMSRIGVMKHLHILEQAGLIRTRKVGRERLHFLDPGPLQNVDSWLTGYRRLWNERMDRLEDLINSTQASAQAAEQEVKEQKDAKA